MEIILLGDIAFNGLISEQPEKNTERFSNVAPILQEADLVFANLETPVKAGDEYNSEKSIIHYASYEVTKDLLNKLNIGCLSLANNHIYDCKMDGLKATINLLDDLGIYHTGAGWKQEHIDPVIMNCDGIRVAFIAYVDKKTNVGVVAFDELLINYFDEQEVIAQIQALRSQVDRIVCSIHWGVDYSRYPTSWQLSAARRLIREGASVIMGHHSHTVQPFERYNGGLIFYGLGGLTYGDDNWRGKMRALKISTKHSFIPVLNCSLEYTSSYKTYELKGNRIEVQESSYLNWSKGKWRWFRLYCKFPFLSSIRRFRETVIEKLYNFFFGYYRNPYVALIDILEHLRRKN